MNPKQRANETGAIAELLEIMSCLRDPKTGCPWDLEQTFTTIVPHTLEEAYEVADAIERNDPTHLCDELGDLLFQVVFHAQLARELGWFNFSDLVSAINRKLIRRHPHVFADDSVADVREQTEAWERHKANERLGKGVSSASALDGVPLALPALVRAQKIQQRAARVGFDWAEIGPVVDKLEEELAELRQALSAEEPAERLQEELGDLMFTGVNLARFLDADAETLVRKASQKFADRFQMVEALAKQRQCELQNCTLDELEAFWQEAKKSGR